MTVIRPNSISGVTSITAQGGDINVFRADGTAGDLTINNIVGAAATFTGVLTYEDVANIDSVGIITARSGIRIGANGTKRETVHLDAGDSGANYLRFTNTGTGNGATDGFNVGINADENALLWNFENKDTIFATNNLERLKITSAGLVGVGQASPTHMLHVDSSNASDSTATAFFKGRIIRFDGAASAHSPRLNLSLDGTDKATILLHRTNDDLEIQTLTASPIRFSPNSTERLRIASDGKIGINESSPANYGIHASQSSQSVYYRADSGSVDSIYGSATSLGLAIAGTTSNHPFVLYANNAERLRIAGDGRITQIGKSGAATSPAIDPLTSYLMNDAESRLQLCSTNSGSNASAIILSNESKHWVVHQRGPVQSNRFDIAYQDIASPTDMCATATKYFSIDTSGHVMMPLNSRFFALNNTGGTDSGDGSTGKISDYFETELVDSNGDYNTGNGRFTAPVDGAYEFHFAALHRALGYSGSAELTFYKNGSNLSSRSFGYSNIGSGGSSNDHQHLHIHGIFNLSAGDYIEVYIHAMSGGMDFYMYQGLGYFSGKLLG